MKLKSRKGMSLILSFGIFLMITLLFAAIQIGINSSEIGKRMARIKFIMSSVENRIRLKTSLPESYVCVSPIPPATIYQCQVPSGFWDTFKRGVSGAGSPEIVVKDISGLNPPPTMFNVDVTNPNTFLIAVKLKYSASEFFLSDRKLNDLRIPKEALLASSSGLCTGGSVIFRGFKADGSANCDPIPSCEGIQGSYFSGLDAKGKSKCKALDSVVLDSNGNILKINGVSCPPSKYINGIKFKTNNNFSNISLDCKDQSDPCTLDPTKCP